MDHTYNYVYTCKTDSGDPFEDSVRTLDDRGGANVPVKIEGDSTVSRLWLVHGGEVDDSASANPEWHGLGMEKEVVDPPSPQTESLRRIVCHFRPQQDRGNSQSRGVVGGRR